MSLDGNGRYGYLDPFAGAQLAVAEAARNVACAGALPIGATNNLNFGNPEKPEIMWQLAEAVRGIGEACRALDIPITGGNVSLYNETDGRAILPTPVLGVVGLIEDATRALGARFRTSGARILLLGEGRGELGGSEYLHTVHGLLRGAPPAPDLQAERQLQHLLVEAASDGLLASAQDCSDGGLAVALAECCFGTDGIGAEVDVPAEAGATHPLQLEATLFGESPARVIVSTDSSRADELLRRARAAGVPARAIGDTGGARIRVRVDGQPAIDVDLHEAEHSWEHGLERHFTRQVA